MRIASVSTRQPFLFKPNFRAKGRLAFSNSIPTQRACLSLFQKFFFHMEAECDVKDERKKESDQIRRSAGATYTTSHTNLTTACSRLQGGKLNSA
jgi:hypothetical protein